MSDLWQLPLGASQVKGNRFCFKLWAPYCQEVSLRLFRENTSEDLAMERDDEGVFSVEAEVTAGKTNYFYVLQDGRERPDPMSRFQPEGVHGPSQVVCSEFSWSDQNWKGIALDDCILYELHIGTFSPEGTFEAAIQKLPYLKKLGVTCLEIMPIAQFPGKRNWGYDGVGLYAPQKSYGGPEGFKKLVDAAHQQGLAVCLDVVYNHLGPEGNYLREFGPYFTDRYHTPWGDALNYDGEGSERVRRFVIDNALYWITEFHVDALRLDAIQGIYDQSERHLLKELQENVQAQAQILGRNVLVMAESDLNDPKIARGVEKGGYGLDAQWSDDLHHALHSILTGEDRGYYQDYGKLQDVAKAFKDGFVYEGKYSPFRQKDYGHPIGDLDRKKLVVCIQNHDQVGNRPYGDRLSTLVSVSAQKLAATLLLFSTNTPLLFMGEEQGAKTPFQYFIDHGDLRLVEAVRQGRFHEFSSFGWKSIPDPQREETFQGSKLEWEKTQTPESQPFLHLYQDLIKLRKEWTPHLFSNEELKIFFQEGGDWFGVQYGEKLGAVFVFASQKGELTLPFSGFEFEEFLHTEDARYGGALSSKRSGKISPQVCFSGPSAFLGKLIPKPCKT